MEPLWDGRGWGGGKVQKGAEQSQELSESLNKFHLETVSALTPPTGDPLSTPVAFPSLWHIHVVASRETRVESWVPELVSPLPQKRGQESEGISGQLENYRIGESGRWYFPGLGKELWEQEGLVRPASAE